MADGIQPQGYSTKNRLLAIGAIANMVIKSLEPIIIEDLASDAGHSTISSMVKYGLKATMAFPLIVKNKKLGTLHLSFNETLNIIRKVFEILEAISKKP